MTDRLAGDLALVRELAERIRREVDDAVELIQRPVPRTGNFARRLPEPRLPVANDRFAFSLPVGRRRAF